MALKTVAVVGASLAGLRATETLRRDGFDGRIVLVGAEPHLPYDRPPLSKQLLAGEVGARRHRAAPRVLRRARSRPAARHARRSSLDLGAQARRPRRRRSRSRSTALVLATGSTPRTLPGTPDLDGIFVLRTLDGRARDPRDASTRDPRVVVVGAGFIGSEVAATCRLRGLEVTVLEALPAPLVRGLGPVLGMVCGELHRDHGVDLRLGVGVAGFEGDGERRARPARRRHRGRRRRRGGGRRRRAGHRLARGVRAHARQRRRVRRDAARRARASSAAGDVARWPNPLFGGELMRLEHWTNASEQGVAAARRLLVRRRRRARAVRAGAVRVVRPVRPQDPERRPLPRRRRDGGRARHRSRSAGSSRCSAAPAASSARSGFSMPAKVMQYRRMIEEQASFDDALEHARAAHDGMTSA